MRVLMISLDRTLLGQGASGDTVERHKQYADSVGELDIIVFGRDTRPQVELRSNLRVYPTNSSRWNHYARAKNLALKLAAERGYDLIVAQDFASPVAASVKRKMKIKFVASIHSMFFSFAWLGFNPGKWLLYWLVRRALVTADGFRVNNEAIERELKRWGIQVPVIVQPTPIDIRSFFVDRKTATTPIEILFVGRLAPEKNLPLLVDSIRRINGDFRLTIIGDGPERERIAGLSADDTRISLAGPKTTEQLVKYFASAQIFVLPSNTESFGQVLLQAAAARCAIVATRTDGALRLLQDEKTALFVSPGNGREMTAALEKLLGDDSLRERLASAAQAQARNYDQSVAISRTIELWRKVAGKK